MTPEAVLAELEKVLLARKGADPETSYVASLYADPARMLKKLGEEATELVIAAAEGKRQAIVHEAADLWFHTLVVLAHHGLSAQDVLAELARRFGVSGHEEKRRRKGEGA